MLQNSAGIEIAARFVMKPIRSAVAVAVALWVAGCTSVDWIRPGASAEQLQADATDCRNWARQEAWWAVERRDRLGLFGWPGPDRSGYQLLEEERLTGDCLRARGYQLVERKG